jgi:hypothetical protein
MNKPKLSKPRPDKAEKGLVPPPQRDAKGHLIKGVSGNDLGRPRSALSVLCREQITKHGLVKVLDAIASRSGDYGRKHKDIQITVSDQILAIKLLLSYGYGIPRHEIDRPGDVKIEVSYVNDHRQTLITNATLEPTHNHQGSQTLQRSLLLETMGEDGSGDGLR